MARQLGSIDYIVRGILIGGSLGVLASVIGILEGDIFRAGALGMVGGFLAGLTLGRIRDAKRRSNDSRQ